jgi:adenosylcobyric acid synthase
MDYLPAINSERHFFAGFGVTSDALDYDGQVDAVLDRLAGHMATHLDLDALRKIAGI